MGLNNGYIREKLYLLFYFLRTFLFNAYIKKVNVTPAVKRTFVDLIF